MLKDTDFFGHNAGGKRAATFEECAQQCWDHTGCMCVSWNGPDSRYKNLNCNYHCSAEGKRSDKGETAAIKGETAAIIRADKTTCPKPPGPPPRPSRVPPSRFRQPGPPGRRPPTCILRTSSRSWSATV